MKKLCSITVIAVFFLVCTIGIQAQTPQTQLNQVELLKQFIGTWKSEMVNDTTWAGEMKSFGDGLEAYFKAELKGNIVSEIKTLMGYDKKNDKLIETDLYKGSDIIVYAFWFTSKNTCIQIPYEYISNPQKAPLILNYEFKSPDLFIETFNQNNKVVAVYRFNRVKK
jgi:hypothetical protein